MKRCIHYYPCMLCLLLASHMVHSQHLQSDTIRLQWKNITPISGNKGTAKTLTFSGAMHLPQLYSLPVHSSSYPGLYLEKVSLQHTVWEEITSEELHFVPKQDMFSGEPDIVLFNGTERKQPNATVHITPLRRNPASGKIEKLLQFTYLLKEGDTPLQMAPPPNSSKVTNSILSQGEWYKLTFNKSGIYKIDYKYLKEMGIDLGTISPSKLQIWGNGGSMLPEACAAERPTDLTETPIHVVGGEDGTFDLNDYILMYAQGPITWQRNGNEPFFRASPHLYSNYSFYFLTVGSQDGKRIQKAMDLPAASISFQSYQTRGHHENNSFNFLGSGRKWYGDPVSDGAVKQLLFTTNPVSANSKAYLISAMLSKSNGTLEKFSLFEVSSGSFKKNYSFQGPVRPHDNGYSYLGDETVGIDSFSIQEWQGIKQLPISYRFQKGNDNSAVGYLDYVSITYETRLEISDNQFDFRQLKSAQYPSCTYVLANTFSIEKINIWDVSYLSQIQEQDVHYTKESVSFTAVPMGTVHEYVAFYGSSFSPPIAYEKLSNQNIKGSATPDLLLVTHPSLLASAQRLAAFRRTHDHLNVLVVTTEEVYNEFASGAQDLVAIRDCARMFYKRPDGTKLRYLLLFGSASYDYKNISNTHQPSSLVPIYESDGSLHPIYSYSSDDFVAMLDDHDGNWENRDKMDLGVGRLPAKTAAEADLLVNKLIGYATNPNSFGDWRQQITFLADDDEEQSNPNDFLKNAENLTKLINDLAPAMTVNKVYIGAYPKEVTGSGTYTPMSTKELNRHFEEGVLIFDYIGHGNDEKLASENAINTSFINALHNQDRLAFLLTATCEFGRYDNPFILSGALRFLLQPKGGAIGLLTTTRPVFQGTNEKLNTAFFYSLLTYSNGVPQRLGEIVRQTKNASIYETVNRNFALLGDPSMQLYQTSNKVIVEQLNSKKFQPFSDTLKAQQKVIVKGILTDWTGHKRTDFSGVIHVKCLDKEITLATLDTPIVRFKNRSNKIFYGSASVINGQFECTFIIPKNINYTVGKGRFAFYALQEGGDHQEAAGAEERFYVGSSVHNAPADVTPPQIKLFMNDESFVDGGLTNEQPLFIAKLSDENGINATQAIGRSIKATLDGDIRKEWILDNYYKADRDSYKTGTIRYPLPPLTPGPHKIQIKVFDTDSNAATGAIEFMVAKQEALSLQHVLNYPNPFTTSTTFHFDHNRAGDDLEVMLQVFTISGKLVRTLMATSHASAAHFNDLHWDGKDDFGDDLGRGVYVYKVTVKALSDGAKKEEFQKMVILN